MARSAAWFLPLTLAAGLVLAPFVACNVYGEDLLVAAPDASSSSGGLEPGRGLGYWSGTGEFACESAKKPSPDDKPRGAQGGTDQGSIVVALRKIDLGTVNPVDGGPANEEWKRLGFDVDGLCTGSSRTCGQSGGPSCAPRQGQLPVDGEYCRDNSFGNLATTLTYASELTSEFGFGSFDCALCTGALNFLVRIQGYNGLANDDAIEVDFFPAVGLETPIPIACQPNLPDSACFLPSMPWKIDRRVVTGANPGDSPSTMRSTTAFVKDGYATIFLPDAMPIYFPGDDTIIRAFPIVVHQGFITGRLEKQGDGTWHVEDGMIGGTTTIPEVLQSLVSIGLCPGETNYTVAQNVIENVADVLVSGEKAAQTPCDAISIGVAFTAYQATLGPAAEAPIRDYCGAGKDGGADSGRDGG